MWHKNRRFDLFAHSQRCNSNFDDKKKISIVFDHIDVENPSQSNLLFVSVSIFDFSLQYLHSLAVICFFFARLCKTVQRERNEYRKLSGSAVSKLKRIVGCKFAENSSVWRIKFEWKMRTVSEICNFNLPFSRWRWREG